MAACVKAQMASKHSHETIGIEANALAVPVPIDPSTFVHFACLLIVVCCDVVLDPSWTWHWRSPSSAFEQFAVNTGRSTQARHSFCNHKYSTTHSPGVVISITILSSAAH